MKKSNLSTYFLMVSICTFIALFFYIVQNSYDNLMRATKEVQQSDILKPIDPNLDISTLDDIDGKTFYSSDTYPVIP